MLHTKEELGAIATKMHLVMPEDLLPSEITFILSAMLKIRNIRVCELTIEKIVGKGVGRWTRRS